MHRGFINDVSKHNLLKPCGGTIALPAEEEFYILSEPLCHLSGTTTLPSLAQDTEEC